jgi:hypothetical protein
MPRRPPFAYPRAETQRRVVERLEAGWTINALGREPGFPSQTTVFIWAREDAGFAQRLAQARDWRNGLRREAWNQRQGFDPVLADAFLIAVKRGVRVSDLVKRPEGPKRLRLNRWRRERPDFEAALTAAIRLARSVRDGAERWPYDEAVVDRIILRICKGETLPELMADPAMPGRAALARWRRSHPEFAGALKVANRSGYRRRARARRRSPALLAAIAAHIQGGGSVRSASMAVPGAPSAYSLYLWLKADPAFAGDVAWAKRMRDDLLMDMALDRAERATALTAQADGRRFAEMRMRLGQVRGGAKGRAFR